MDLDKFVEERLSEICILLKELNYRMEDMQKAIDEIKDTTVKIERNS